LSGKYQAGDTIRLVLNDGKIACEKGTKRKTKTKEEATAEA
jgi:hypothetical protein